MAGVGDIGHRHAQPGLEQGLDFPGEPRQTFEKRPAALVDQETRGLESKRPAIEKFPSDRLFEQEDLLAEGSLTDALGQVGQRLAQSAMTHDTIERVQLMQIQVGDHRGRGLKRKRTGGTMTV
jgi:hypothetical protein